MTALAHACAPVTRTPAARRVRRPEKPSPKPPETPTPETCPTCAAGAPCVLHAPLFRELIDPPGVPAGPPLPVHETPPALPFHRPRRPRSAADRDAEVQ